MSWREARTTRLTLAVRLHLPPRSTAVEPSERDGARFVGSVPAAQPEPDESDRLVERHSAAARCALRCCVGEPLRGLCVGDHRRSSSRSLAIARCRFRGIFFVLVVSGARTRAPSRSEGSTARHWFARGASLCVGLRPCRAAARAGQRQCAMRTLPRALHGQKKAIDAHPSQA
jgi:hypothetical protein